MNKTVSYVGLVIPESYRAYAETEAEALAIAEAIEQANPLGKFTGKVYNLPYAPRLWSISLAIKEA